MTKKIMNEQPKTDKNKETRPNVLCSISVKDSDPKIKAVEKRINVLKSEELKFSDRKNSENRK